MLADKRWRMTNTNRTGPTTRPPLSLGAAAPEIVLPRGEGQTWASRDFRGKPIVVVFYPADWEPVSTDQLRSYNHALPQIRGLDAELVGISVDGTWCHRAFAQDLGLRFPLLSDSHPRGATARGYGVYRRRHGMTARALFVIDGDGVIRWRYLGHHEVNPGIDGMLTALEALATPDGARSKGQSARYDGA